MTGGGDLSDFIQLPLQALKALCCTPPVCLHPPIIAPPVAGGCYCVLTDGTEVGDGAATGEDMWLIALRFWPPIRRCPLPVASGINTQI